MERFAKYSLGKPIRSSLTREKPMRLVANGTDGRMAARSEMEEIENEPAPAFHRRPAVSDAGSKDLFERQKDIDYLDIPSFLRTQAD